MMVKDWRMFEKNEDGKLKYIKGSWRKMFQLPEWQTILVVAVVVMSYFMIDDYKDVYNNPCGYCLVNGMKANETFNNSVTFFFNISNNDSDPQDFYVKKDINLYDNITV